MVDVRRARRRVAALRAQSHEEVGKCGSESTSPKLLDKWTEVGRTNVSGRRISSCKKLRSSSWTRWRERPGYYCVIIRRRENPRDAPRGPSLHTHGTPPSYQTWLLSRRLPPATPPRVRPARHPRAPRSHLAMFFAPLPARVSGVSAASDADRHPLPFLRRRRQDFQDQVRAVPRRRVWRRPQAGARPNIPAQTAIAHPPRRSPRVRPASLPVSLSRRGDDVGGAVPSGFTPRETSTPRPDDDSNRRRALTPHLPLPPRSTRRAPTSAASSVASPAPPRASRTPRPTRTRA
jgi:hypothetical protein